MSILPVAASAQDLPPRDVYEAMLDVNKTSGWVQFRNFDGRQLVYFTVLQTMHCRLSEIRYSINSEALDERFGLIDCNPQMPFSLPSDLKPENVYLSLPPETAETVAVQVLWDDGVESEIMVYKPCDDAGEATCAVIAQ